MSDMVFNESGGGAAFELRINGANLELLRNGAIVDFQPLASVDSFTLNGGTGNDTLQIDGLIALSGGVTFNGGAQSGPPGDSLALAGGTASSATVTYTNASDGTAVLTAGVTAMTANFTGIEPMDISGLTIADLMLVLPNTHNEAVLEDDGTTGNSIQRLRSVTGTFETTVFSNPTNSLTINGGDGTDNLTVNLTDSLGAVALTIDLGGTTTFTNLGTPSTALTSVTTDAPGTVVFNTSVTTTGAQTYSDDAAIIGANTTLTSTGSGNVSLVGTVNGAFSLTVNTAGTGTFGGALGGTTALTSVTTDAGGSTALNGGSVTTTGAQSYNDVVTLGANT